VTYGSLPSKREFNMALLGAYFYHGADEVRVNVGAKSRKVAVDSSKKEWDTDADTFCAKKSENFIMKATWNNYTLERVPVSDRMLSSKLFDACFKKDTKDVKWRPVCNSAEEADGRCVQIAGVTKLSLFTKENMANPKYKDFPQDLLRGTFTYIAGSVNPTFSMLEQAGKERLSQPWDRNGDTLCVVVDRAAGDFKFKDHTFHRMVVTTNMTSDYIVDKCKRKDMKPPCEHPSYADGKCEIVAGDFHLASFKDQAKLGLDPSVVRNAYWYAGSANTIAGKLGAKVGMAIMSTGVDNPDHRWGVNGKGKGIRVDWNGDTYCVKRTETFVTKTVVDNRGIFRVPVEGEMNSVNVVQACAKKNMRPICDHIGIADGQCTIVTEGQHKDFRITLPAGGADPSDPKSPDVADFLPRSMVQGTFIYAGEDQQKESPTMMDMANGNRLSTKKDENGDTLCTMTNYTAATFNSGGFNVHQGFAVQRTKVDGEMNSENIAKACETIAMRPVCDTGGAADGVCHVIANGNIRLSDGKVFGGWKVVGAYFYSGRLNAGRSTMFNGKTHVWSAPGRDRNGDTLCARRFKPLQGFRMHGYRFTRVTVPVNTRMTEQALLSACSKVDARPLCHDIASFDGQCIMVGGAASLAGRRLLTITERVSTPENDFTQLGETALPARNQLLSDMVKEGNAEKNYVKDTFTYSRNAANLVEIVYDDGTQWRKATASDMGGATICVRPDRQDKVFGTKDGKVQFNRVQVTGFMTSENIKAACVAAGGMQPLCESEKFSDENCLVIGTAHWSHPKDARVMGLDLLQVAGVEDKVRGAYFYVKPALQNSKSIMNRGDKDALGPSHIWSRPGIDKNGDTYCAKFTSKGGPSNCNCPSLNALMQRSNAVTVACEKKNLTSTEELGDALENDREEILTRMAEIANAASPKPKPAELGESLRASLRTMTTPSCMAACGDLRGLLRQIASDEEACEIRDTSVYVNKTQEEDTLALVEIGDEGLFV